MIYVIGLGFVGLTTAVGFAQKGNNVVGIDRDIDKLNNLKSNIIEFHEPNLKKFYVSVRKKKKLILHKEINIKNEENFYFICVGTPSKSDGSIDISLIKKVIKKIVENINRIKNKNKNYIIIKSTVLPGTAEYFSKIYSKYKNLFFISNPEFLREGFAWKDFMYPDKIVIGAKNILIAKKIKKIYNKFRARFFFLSVRGSEFLKYLSNAALASMISFSNEMLLLAEKNKILEINNIFNAFHCDKRWFGRPASMSKYIYPGLGFGGYCLPKDLKALIMHSKFKKIDTPILKSVLKINKSIFNYQFRKVVKNLKKNSKIYLLGMSFKPFSDDLRESVSLNFAKKLYKMKYKNLIICDPISQNKLKKIFDKLKIINYPKKDNNATYILLTAWPSYVNFVKKNKNLKIIDLRYVF